LRLSIYVVLLGFVLLLLGGSSLAGSLDHQSGSKSAVVPVKSTLGTSDQPVSKLGAAQPHNTAEKELSTTITLLPSGNSTPLSSVASNTNVFVATYTSDGILTVAYIGNSPVTLSTDPGTNVTIDSASKYNGTASNEEWVIDSTGVPFTVPSGSSPTIYYYDLLDQVPYYEVYDGGSPPGPALTYYTAPAAVSGSNSPTKITYTLTMKEEPILVLRGTEASATNPLASNSTVRWATATSSWLVNSTFQIPDPIEYYQQYNVAIGYTVDKGSGYSAPQVSCPSFGNLANETAGKSTWIDAGRGDSVSSCYYSTVLPGSNQEMRWAIQSMPVPIVGPGTITEEYYFQYPLTIEYGIAGLTPPSPPSVNSTFFGTVLTEFLQSNDSVNWIDAGSHYSISNPLSSSTSTERWQTTAITNGTLNQATTIKLTFYQQFLVLAAYSIDGGGSPAAPQLSYSSYGNQSSITLSSEPQSVWTDGGSMYSAPSVLLGSNSTERWYLAQATGTVKKSENLNLLYQHQFLLSVTGGDTGSTWLDNNATATVSFPGVYDRANGMGDRVDSYSLDGGASVTVTPTSQNITVTLPADGPQTLVITSVVQYEVSIVGAPASALSSISQPTIPGDNYWYDSGTPVTVTLNGVWGRDDGAGSRLDSCSVNGGSSTSISTPSTVTPVSTDPISSPLLLKCTTASQFELTVSSGSTASLTSPSIQGDTGWYDSGTNVTLVLNYVWDAVTNQSRMDAMGYILNGGVETLIPRGGDGATFSLSVVMSGPESVTVNSITQYYLELSGGSGTEVSVASPTGDGYYDSGTVLQVTTDYQWGVANGTRQVLTSYTLDGQKTAVASSRTPIFMAPTITLSSPQQLAFTSAIQYSVGFTFSDHSGSIGISPTSFSVTENGSKENLTNSPDWVDSGTRVIVTAVFWEGYELTPVGTASDLITSSETINVETDLYSATLKVTDALGLAVSGASVSVDLPNGTVVSRVTSGSGTVLLGLLPAQPYEATVSNLGSTSKATVNPGTTPSKAIGVSLSYPEIYIIVAAVIVILLFSFLRITRRSSHKKIAGKSSP